MVETISSMQRLRSLEISGHSERYYDPSALGRLPMLDDLRVMMPDSLFRDKLRGLLRTLSERKRGGLRGLGIIARVSCHGRCHLSRTEKSYGILMARTRP